MASIRVEKLAHALGAEVSGADLSRPLPAPAFAEIRRAWLDHLVIRFRGQTLSDPGVRRLMHRTQIKDGHAALQPGRGSPRPASG